MTDDATETPEETSSNADPTVEAPDTEEAHEEPEETTFSAAYVRKLRDENAAQRVKAKRADEYAREVFRLKVAATGRLADPTDLPFDEELLESDEALEAAIEALLAERPHYAARTPKGDVGQGAVGGAGHNVDLAGILRSRA